MLLEFVDTTGFKRKCLDDTHAIDALGQVLVDGIVSFADGPIQCDQVFGLQQ